MKRLLVWLAIIDLALTIVVFTLSFFFSLLWMIRPGDYVDIQYVFEQDIHTLIIADGGIHWQRAEGVSTSSHLPVFDISVKKHFSYPYGKAKILVGNGTWSEKRGLGFQHYLQVQNNKAGMRTAFIHGFVLPIWPFIPLEMIHVWYAIRVYRKKHPKKQH
jgi:hypothetical protein